jgi:hypothetical protein
MFKDYLDGEMMRLVSEMSLLDRQDSSNNLSQQDILDAQDSTKLLEDIIENARREMDAISNKSDVRSPPSSIVSGKIFHIKVVEY